MTLKCSKSILQIDGKEWYSPYNLSSNGTLGGDSFAVWASNNLDSTNYPAWKLFDGDGYDYWVNNSIPVDLIFYNPTPIRLHTVMFTNTYDGQGGTFTTGSIYGSNDGVTYTLIGNFTNSYDNPGDVYFILEEGGLESPAFYKYYKVAITGGTQNNVRVSDVYLAGYEPKVRYSPIKTITTQRKSNILITGTLTDNNNVISGFSSSNYARLPGSLNFGYAHFRYQVKFDFTSANNNNAWIIGGDTDRKKPCVGIMGGKLITYISSNGSTWDIAEGTLGTSTLLTDTPIYCRLEYDGSFYTISTSYGGLNFTNEIVIENSMPINQNNYPALLGYSINGTSSISHLYLDECYISTGDNYENAYWKGIRPETTIKMYSSNPPQPPSEVTVTNLSSYNEFGTCTVSYFTDLGTPTYTNTAEFTTPSGRTDAVSSLTTGGVNYGYIWTFSSPLQLTYFDCDTTGTSASWEQHKTVIYNNNVVDISNISSSNPVMADRVQATYYVSSAAPNMPVACKNMTIKYLTGGS